MAGRAGPRRRRLVDPRGRCVATERIGLMTYVTCPTIRYHPAVALMQIGGKHQQPFMRWAQAELLPALRSL